ncbi:MAG: ABC-2 transporter permease [Candidatus Izemoplasmatales bacterium]
MKNLLYKEFKLATHPTTYLFLSFGLMLLIPNYPGYVGFFYICLSIFFVFLTGRENRDIFFTVSLPIKKTDAVKARCMMIAIIELVQILIAIPFAFIGNSINPAGNLAGIETNVAFFGFVFMMFSIYNIVFIPLFYKTTYKIGIPFLYGGIAFGLFYVLVEMLVWIPSSIQTFLDTTNPAIMLQQIPILIIGIIIWFAVWIITYKKAASNFEKVDI